MLKSAILVFSGRERKLNGTFDMSTIQTWSSSIIDDIVNEERGKKLLPDRKGHVEVVGTQVKYTPTQTYTIARNLFTKKFRRKKQWQP